MANAQDLIDTANEKRKAEPKALRKFDNVRENAGRRYMRFRTNKTASAQDIINSSGNVPQRQTQRIPPRKQIQRYRSQPSYGGLSRENIITGLRKSNPIQGNFKEGYSFRRLPIAKRRIPGQPMIRPESTGQVTRFITGRSPPRTESKGYAGRGRPKGTYKYYIPGVGPAGVFEWRKYQRFKQRQLAMQLQQQSPDMNYSQALSSVKQVQRQMPTQQQQMQPFDDGWGLLRIKSPFSMTGNGNAATPINPIANVQAPVGNANTAYFSEPNFFGTGQVLRQRPAIGGFGLW